MDENVVWSLLLVLFEINEALLVLLGKRRCVAQRATHKLETCAVTACAFGTCDAKYNNLTK